MIVTLLDIKDLDRTFSKILQTYYIEPYKVIKE